MKAANFLQRKLRRQHRALTRQVGHGVPGYRELPTDIRFRIGGEQRKPA